MYEYTRRPSKLKKNMLILLCLIMVSIGSIFFYSMYVSSQLKSTIINSNVNAKRLYNENTEEKSTNSKSLEDITKSRVGISKIKSKGITVLDLNAPQELGLGSGVVFSEKGYIITNWHIVGSKYNTCYVTLENGETYNGNVLWADSDLDLAIVKINGTSCKAITIGNSSELKLGDEVWAIGNPVGIEFQRTITKGIVSGLNRTIKIEDENGQNYMENLIQTDASINSGNSGGALINEKGELIGINTVKISSAEGIGFAVPIDIIKPIIANYEEEGRFEEAYLRYICI